MFLPILEKEYWNSHYIRPSKNADCLAGIPNDLFEMPLYYG